jgi:hypothetical protein
MHTKLFALRLAAATLVVALPLSAVAQQLERDVGVVSEDVEGRLEGYSYQEGPVSTLEFHGTAIALGAAGEGEVEFQDGRARVEITVRKMPGPASLAFLNLCVVGRDGRWPPTISARSKRWTGSALWRPRHRCRSSP